MMRFFSLLGYFCLGTSLLFGSELTLKQADTIADKVIEMAVNSNLQLSVAVMDQHGNLKAFKRMDDSSLLSAESAKMKAYTSAVVPFSTSRIAELFANDPNNAFNAIPGLLLIPGGVPIITPSGEHIGGIGVGGARSSIEDEKCAYNARAALE